MTVTFPAALAGATTSSASLRQFLHGLPGVDEVGAAGRATSLGTRSVKAASKAWAIDLAIRMVDLTTLEGMDSPGKVRAMCAKALRPDPTDPSAPPVAAVCVYGDLVATARSVVGDSVHVAAVATSFPSGRASLGVKLLEFADGKRFPVWIMVPAFWGYVFIDFANAVIRPAVVVAIVAFYGLVKLARYQTLVALSVPGDDAWRDAIITLWSGEDYAVLMAAIGFYFGNRTLRNYNQNKGA